MDAAGAQRPSAARVVGDRLLRGAAGARPAGRDDLPLGARPAEHGLALRPRQARRVTGARRVAPAGLAPDVLPGDVVEVIEEQAAGQVPPWALAQA